MLTFFKLKFLVTFRNEDILDDFENLNIIMYTFLNLKLKCRHS